MTFTGAVGTCLRKYADFNGRAGRPEYWWFALFQGLVVGIPSGLAGALMVASLPMSEGGQVNGPMFALAMILLAVASLISLALILPSLAVSARRLHDIGLSGWLLLLTLIPFGGIAIFVMTLLPTKPVASA